MCRGIVLPPAPRNAERFPRMFAESEKYKLWDLNLDFYLMVKRKRGYYPYGIRKRRRIGTARKRRIRGRRFAMRKRGRFPFYRGPTGGFPKYKFVKMKFHQTFSLDLATNGLVGAQWKIYRANSVYDPDYNLGGGIPSGYEEMSHLYHRYVVVGAKMSLTATSRYNTEVHGRTIAICLFKRDSITQVNLSDFHKLAEHPNCSFKIVNHHVGNYPVRMRKTFNLKKDMRHKGIFTDHNVSANFGDSPQNVYYFQVAPVKADGGTWASAVEMTFNVIIVYYVICYDPKTVNLYTVDEHQNVDETPAEEEEPGSSFEPDPVV